MVRTLVAGATFKRAPRRISAEITEIDLGGRHAVIALPTAFMNESGGPVSSLVKYFKPHLTGVVLVHDDIDLPFGKLRFHAGRGAGGHNGVASVMRSLGSREVWRMKLGVGRPPVVRSLPTSCWSVFPNDNLTMFVSWCRQRLTCWSASAPKGGDAATQAAGTPPPDSASPRREVRRRHRPGHYQHPVRGRRPLWSDRGHRSAGARSDLPRPGWVEHDAAEIWRVTQAVVAGGLAAAGATAGDLAAVGVTNQRETTVVWDRTTGTPLAPAIVWQDTRTDALVAELSAVGGADRFRSRCGLPLATYFSGPKVRWLLERNPPGSAVPPIVVRLPSARSTPGCCGTSPVVTSPMSPMPHARC